MLVPVPSLYMLLRGLVSTSTTQVCNNFKKVYLKYRSQAERDGCPWQTKNEALFLRLDTYRERNKSLQDFTKTVVQFNKLEKIEICGTKGKQARVSKAAYHW